MSLSLKDLWSKVSMRREKRKRDRAQTPRGWGCKMQEEASETIDMWPFNLTTNSIQFWEYIVMIKIMDWKLASYIDGYIILKKPFRGKFFDRNTRPPYLPLLRNLYADQEATVRTWHGTMDWFQIGKEVHQGCILSPSLFNFSTGYIMKNARLDEAPAGIQIARRNINNLR